MAVTITAQMVKELRDKTSAGMNECKKALVDNNGDMQAAVEALRKAGIAKAENRQDRATKEGVICIAGDAKAAVMLEVLCETDFVAKNEQFLAFAGDAAKRAFEKSSGNADVTELAQKQEAEEIGALFAKFGEKMTIRRAIRMEAQDGNVIAPYLYGNGKIGLLVEIGGEFDDALKHDICMHIAAFKPLYVRSSEIPAEAIAKEKEINAAQLAEQNKPAAMIEKILMGKINKWFAEVCLVNQPWIKDEKSSLAKLFPKVNVIRFARWAAGEEN